MGDVIFGYVYDFGAARGVDRRARARGALLDGAPLGAPGPKDPIEILSLRGRRRPTFDRRARRRRCVGVAERLRVMGSLALSLCHLAAGRVDAVCSLKPARSIDIAAAQLLVRERGYAIELFEDPPFAAAPLDLGQRSRVVAAATSAVCAELAPRSPLALVERSSAIGASATAGRTQRWYAQPRWSPTATRS